MTSLNLEWCNYEHIDRRHLKSYGAEYDLLCRSIDYPIAAIPLKDLRQDLLI